jgi:hypothetical protein
MTGNEFVAVRDALQAVIREAEVQIQAARERVLIPPISQLRPARAEDIKPGSVLYYRVDEAEPEHYWKLVVEVLHPDDDFKAYFADDGCRYGLHRAWVEIDDPPTTGLLASAIRLQQSLTNS